MSPPLHIGLMSGTSLDGIDAVVASFDPRPCVRATHYECFPAGLRTELLSLLHPGVDELERCARAANELAQRYAHAVESVLKTAGLPASSIECIGCHGQTVRHRPQYGYTVQLVNGARLAELTGISVVCDFRSRDVAAGGQGAPLVPAFHASVFRDPVRNRAIVNLGGIANITALPAAGEVTGFDCGPGNGLLDEWIQHKQGLPFDSNGTWASSGNVLAELLDVLLGEPFFTEPPPKSTGRETFNLSWLRLHLRDIYRPQDVQATLTEFTARGVAQALEHFCQGVDEIYLCGGGASNTYLCERIRSLLPGRDVASTAALGLDPDWVEALAFAWLARETRAGRPGNLPAVTGARGPRVLGCIFPA
jgi:anhydro-N-acetylmuramic acid kinase